MRELAKQLQAKYNFSDKEYITVVSILNDWNGEAKEGNRSVHQITVNYCKKDFAGVIEILNG